MSDHPAALQPGGQQEVTNFQSRPPPSMPAPNPSTQYPPTAGAGEVQHQTSLAGNPPFATDPTPTPPQIPNKPVALQGSSRTSIDYVRDTTTKPYSQSPYNYSPAGGAPAAPDPNYAPNQQSQQTGYHPPPSGQGHPGYQPAPPSHYASQGTQGYQPPHGQGSTASDEVRVPLPPANAPPLPPPRPPYNSGPNQGPAPSPYTQNPPGPTPGPYTQGNQGPNPSPYTKSPPPSTQQIHSPYTQQGGPQGLPTSPYNQGLPPTTFQNLPYTQGNMQPYGNNGTPPPRTPTPPKRILFYNRHEPHYGFTNFSNHPVKFKDKVYPTSEHLFQAIKFLPHRPLLAEHIRTNSDNPRDALSEATRFKPEVKPGWIEGGNIAAMDEAIWHKFNQHKDLKKELLSTGDAELIENSPVDAFWGCGRDGKGENKLGIALMRLRDRFRAEKQGNKPPPPQQIAPQMAQQPVGNYMA